MRILTSSALALALISSNVSAAETASLAPGKPAGVKQAVLGVDPVYFLFLAVAIGVIAGVASSGGSNTPAAASAAAAGSSSSTTTTTG